MRTQLHSDILATDQGQLADSILRSCVHCGFCNATCPTYLETGNELDGPRGRIYLINAVLEENQSNTTALHHLDRCLNCRACETTCPSGVQYGDLLNIAYQQIIPNASRTWRQKLFRFAVGWLLPATFVAGMLYKMAYWLRPLLRKSLAAQLPPPAKSVLYKRQGSGQPPNALRFLLLPGCVQSYTRPATLAAAKAILEHLGATVNVAPATCCGALHYHTDQHQRAGYFAQRNLQEWQQQGPLDAIVSLASGCGIHLKSYSSLFPEHADINVPIKDIAEVLVDFDLSLLPKMPQDNQTSRVAWHKPCTFQHGRPIDADIPKLLAHVGYQLTQVADNHLCCGSAGAYSLEQPDMSMRLKNKKLTALLQDTPEIIATANIGCQLHLTTGTAVPVQHWVELMAAPLASKQQSTLNL